MSDRSSGLITCDRFKDDPCYGCKYAVMKPESDRYTFSSPYGCTNRRRIQAWSDHIHLTQRSFPNGECVDRSIADMIEYCAGQCRVLLDQLERQHYMDTTDHCGYREG